MFIPTLNSHHSNRIFLLAVAFLLLAAAFAKPRPAPENGWQQSRREVSLRRHVRDIISSHHLIR